MLDKVTGIGLIAQAIADLLVTKPPDFAKAYSNLMLGLGKLGVHTAIVKELSIEEAKDGKDSHEGHDGGLVIPPKGK